MSTIESGKFSLRQQPTSREKIIVFVGIFVLLIVFYKSCIVQSNEALAELQEKIDKTTSEKEELSKLGAVLSSSKPKEISSVNWIGDKKSVELSSDSLLKAAQENAAVLIKFTLPESKEIKNYIFKPTSIVLAGNLADIGAYIESSEHLAVPLVIEHIVIEPNTEFADIVTLHIEGGFYAPK